MLLFISKFIRIIKIDFIPSTCYAYQWLSPNLPHSCDCRDVCKFPPKSISNIRVDNPHTTFYFTRITQ